LEEAFLFAGVQLDGAENIGEVEAIYDDPRLVGKSSGADDVHAPGSQRAGHVGKEAFAVAGDDGEVEEMARGAQVQLHRIAIKVLCHLEMAAYLLRKAGLQVALRKAFEELLQVVILRRGHHGTDAV